MRRLLLSLALLLAARPGGAQLPGAADEVAGWLGGTFDTKDQAAIDAEVPSLRLVIVAVPKSRLSFGAPVLYREEAKPNRLERPVRQGFIRLEEDASGGIVVRFFELKDGAAAAGKWRTPADLALFGRNDIRERTACAITLSRKGDHYEGTSAGSGCAPSLLGANRASSEIRVWPDRLETWDRGFDGRGEQVWGPRKGPYRWTKRTALPPEGTP